MSFPASSLSLCSVRQQPAVSGDMFRLRFNAAASSADQQLNVKFNAAPSTQDAELFMNNSEMYRVCAAAH